MIELRLWVTIRDGHYFTTAPAVDPVEVERRVVVARALVRPKPPKPWEPSIYDGLTGRVADRPAINHRGSS